MEKSEQYKELAIAIVGRSTIAALALRQLRYHQDDPRYHMACGAAAAIDNIAHLLDPDIKRWAHEMIELDAITCDIPPRCPTVDDLLADIGITPLSPDSYII